MANGNLLEAANLAGLHGYTLVPKSKIENLRTRFGLEAEEELSDLFEVDSLSPKVEFHPDDVAAWLDILRSDDYASLGTIIEGLEEVLETTVNG